MKLLHKWALVDSSLEPGGVLSRGSGRRPQQWIHHLRLIGESRSARRREYRHGGIILTNPSAAQSSFVTRALIGKSAKERARCGIRQSAFTRSYLTAVNIRKSLLRQVMDSSCRRWTSSRRTCGCAEGRPRVVRDGPGVSRS